MKRRDFVKTACTLGVAAAAIGAGGEVTAQLAERGARRQRGDASSPQQSLIELRVFHCGDAAKRDKLAAFIAKSFAPAVKRIGETPVGILNAPADANEGKGTWENDLFVLFQHNRGRLGSLNQRLLADTKFVSDAAEYFAIPLQESLFSKYDSTLFLGFPSCPAIETPVKSADRLFQLRYYQSYNMERNAAKIAMFEDGELALFRKCGMHPVFFGETLYGDMMPNLTYMIGFENKDEQKKGWDTFVNSDAWKEMKSNPKYKDTATTIVNIVLRPCDGSDV
ncbi:MAG: NIPSNAP family protein [Thermoguttaceae bacterium]